MSWVYLFIAGIFEIVWAVALKYADGFSNWFYSAVTIIGMVASVYFLAVAMRTIPLGTAYAIWTGIGCIVGFLISKHSETRRPVVSHKSVLLKSGLST